MPVTHGVTGSSPVRTAKVCLLHRAACNEGWRRHASLEVGRQEKWQVNEKNGQMFGVIEIMPNFAPVSKASPARNSTAVV